MKVSGRDTALRLRAKAARRVAAHHGPDLDLDAFARAPERPRIAGLDVLPSDLRRAVGAVGIAPDEQLVAGTWMLHDRSVIYERLGPAWAERMQLLPIEQAREQLACLDEHWFRAVEVDEDKYTAEAALAPTGGFFLRVLPGERVEFPFQTCFLLQQEAARQVVHNVIVLEEQAQLRLLTGCAAPGYTQAGVHVGVTEVYLKRGASLAETMLHHWSPGFHVRPRVGVVVGEGATYVSNYLLLDPARSVQSRARVRLAGSGARAQLNAILVGRGDSQVDLDTVVSLEADETRAESLSRAIAADRSSLTVRARLIGQHDSCRGHIECRGMSVSPDAEVHSIPKLDSEHAPNAELSHEASVGPIAEEVVDYLTTRGLSRDEAFATITRGFLRLPLPGLPEPIEARIRALIEMTAEQAL